MPALLTREQFRTQVLGLLGGRCCVAQCPEPAVDAHHILERALWPDGGYYLGNGAPLCSAHHLAAERTLLQADRLRAWCGHAEVLLPPHLAPGVVYDKWGNQVHTDGTRSPGEMFHTAQVQAALSAAGLLHLFDHRVRYPRTLHLPDSPGRTKDDRVITTLAELTGVDLVVTEKMDGGNTTWMTDACYARSTDSADHPSRHYVKNLWAARRGDIPYGWRVCGEDLYATRSVPYEDLPGYFMVFAVFDQTGLMLPWDQTAEWAELLDLPTVPVLYRGSDLSAARAAWAGQREAGTSEGFVVRDAAAVAPAGFATRVAKWVRPAHVRTRDDFRARDDFAVNGLRAG